MGSEGGNNVSSAVCASPPDVFVCAIRRQLRESRLRQKPKLTMAEVCRRTGGAVRPSSLASYESGRRSLRIDVVWAITRALGEDLAAVLRAAEQIARQPSGTTRAESLSIDIDRLLYSRDPRLAPVQRWFELQCTGPRQVITLDTGAILALASLMGVPLYECRLVLYSTVHGVEHLGPARPRRSAARPQYGSL